MNSEILLKYQELAHQFQSKCLSYKKRLKQLSFARLICFIAIVPAWFYLNPISNLFALITAFMLVITFLFLVKKFISTEKQVRFYEQLSSINTNEIEAIQRNFKPF